ncbi:histidinol dehydrogenase [Marininema halotolerans]|uniref:Histidinol dehydrogenase n=1 Tax=Marininema halotolerans TaxID=1155944 RepID=A0A1I6NX66_9BACL|nr:histidinol dehydrogenase [Marininema halotolerans]SFS32572.1 histidinol dehydrogenase [Marininema halotolerans]
MIAIVKPDELITRREEISVSSKEDGAVKEILSRIRREGDKAVRELTAQFDGVELSTFEVTDVEIEAAVSKVSSEVRDALTLAAKRIRKYHERQKQNSWMDTEEDGTVLGQLIRPLQKVGLYVPGGRAAYPSTVLMTAIPAAVAGVEEVIMVTPPDSNGEVPSPTLVAAREAGVTRIYKIGGAQAIAALAYGTESISSVDKIVGPGNAYVAHAKRLVYGQVDIDSIAGPSEIVVIADEHANARYIAADLISQAEHDPMASAVLLTPSTFLAEKVTNELLEQCEGLPRRKIATTSLINHGALCITQDLNEAMELANRLAPEHLELMVEDPWRWVGAIKNAGALFLGQWSPEAVGDYLAGPNHVLPTNGTARFFSPLSVEDFSKKTSLISYSQKALLRDGPAVIAIAEAEGLTGHAASIRARIEKEE